MSEPIEHIAPRVDNAIGYAMDWLPDVGDSRNGGVVITVDREAGRYWVQEPIAIAPDTDPAPALDRETPPDPLPAVR
jgi:hypothetical protein